MAPVVSVLFARSRSIGGLVIRGVTWSAWSHCAVEFIDRGESFVVESTWPRGVIVTDSSVFRRRMSRVETVHVSVPDPAAAMRFAKAQVGKPYDTWGVIGLGIHREWDDPESWWCSEHVAASLAAGGKPLFSRARRRVTPQHLWMVL